MRLRGVASKLFALAWERSRPLRAKRPTSPSSQWLREGFAYVIEAAKAERAVAFGAFFTVLAFVLMTGLWAYIGLAVFTSPLVFIVQTLFLTLVVSGGLSVPIFFVLAWHKLYMREWVVNERGIVERWVNPAQRLGAHPAHLWDYMGSKVLIAAEYADADGVLHRYAMPAHRESVIYTDIDVHNAADKRAVQEFFKPEVSHVNERINQALIVALIIFSLFWSVALVSDQGA